MASASLVLEVNPDQGTDTVWAPHAQVFSSSDVPTEEVIVHGREDTDTTEDLQSARGERNGALESSEFALNVGSSLEPSAWAGQDSPLEEGAQVRPDPATNPDEGRRSSALKGQIFWDVGEVLPKRRLDYAMELLDRTSHSLCTGEHAGRVEECMVCLEDMLDGQIVATLPCNHTFHYDCIASWLRCKLQAHHTGRCPNCNFQIVIPLAQPQPLQPVVPPPVVRVRVVHRPDDPVTCCGLRMRRAVRLVVVSMLIGVVVLSTLIIAYFSKS